MKEVLTKKFWQDVKQTFDEAQQNSPPKDSASRPPAEVERQREFAVGDAVVTKIPELNLNDFAVTQLLPNFNSDILIVYPDWIHPETFDLQSGKVSLSVHTWLIRHQGKVILIDTGAGNDKERPTLQVLDHLHQPYLERLRSAGVEPGEVDFILLTHIHADHVGWNTRWDGTQWAPTFPNAIVICSDREWRYSAALAAHDQEAIAAIRAEAGLGDPVRIPVSGVFSDSMKPLENSGRIRRIEVNGSEVLDGFRFLSTPGHSIDHAAIELTSQGKKAVFGGDVLHHPFELNQMDLVSVFCEFPEAARASRRWLAEHVEHSNASYFSSHFPGTSAGSILATDGKFSWRFSA